MVLVVIECFCVVECRVLVFHDDGFSFGYVPQPISYWGQSSFPDSSGSFSTSISLIFGLVCQGAVLFAGCQFLACALNGLGPSFFVQLLAKCPGCAHLRHSCSRILLWNSSLEILNLGFFSRRVQFHRVAAIPIAIVGGLVCPIWVSRCGGLPLDVFRRWRSFDMPDRA